MRSLVETFNRGCTDDLLQQVRLVAAKEQPSAYFREFRDFCVIPFPFSFPFPLTMVQTNAGVRVTQNGARIYSSVDYILGLITQFLRGNHYTKTPPPCEPDTNISAHSLCSPHSLKKWSHPATRGQSIQMSQGEGTGLLQKRGCTKNPSKLFFLGSQVRNMIKEELLVFQGEAWIFGKSCFYPFLQECIIDEDCETGKYCQFSTFEYKCQLCKPQHTVSPEWDGI